MTREEAILSLWRDAIADIVIVHLDPAAHVVCEVNEVLPSTIFGNEVRGLLRIEDARDTSQLDRKTVGVSLAWKGMDWPGRSFVHSYIAACWSATMAHEGLETTLYRSKFDGAKVSGSTRVHDPHTTTVRIDEGTHFATSGRMEELVKRFIGDHVCPQDKLDAELEILERMVSAGCVFLPK